MENDDFIATKVNNDLIENIAKQNSFVKDIEIKNKEPVALDLDQILSDIGAKCDFIVRPSDVISIPESLERVVGEVTSPLKIRYDKSYSFKDYIDQSGGFLQSAKKGRSYV